jgi:uncharacterized protein (TIGR02246 family)
MIPAMNTPTFKSAVASLIVWTGALVPALAQSPAPSAKGPEVVVAQFVDTWNAHDMATLDDLFATDIDWVTASGARLSGREKVRAWLVDEHANWARTTRMEAANIYVRHLNRSTAMVFFEWRIHSAKGAAGAPVRHGNNLFVVRQFGPGWVVAAGQVARKGG